MSKSRFLVNTLAVCGLIATAASAQAQDTKVAIGISGWTYPPWRGRYYPKGWPQHRELQFASHQVASIEINGSFYSLQRPASYRGW